MDLSRRHVLKLGGIALAATAVRPSHARGQTPKRGGTLALRTWDPPHFDPFQTISYKTHIALSFTHSRLLKHKAGPNVVPGTFAIEGDLAESWSQPNETTYVFKLRKGVRWHNKPPVNGRELTADDVVYSVNHFLTVKGNANAYMLRSLEKVEAVDRHTVKFTLKEPFVWFLDMLANPMAVAIIAREVVEKYGDLKKAESVVGTGPWMLDAYRPNVGLTFVSNPGYFIAGLPYIDRVEMAVDEDNASRIAAFLAGKYDLGWEFPGTINRTDLVQIKDTLKQKRPNLKTVEFPSAVMSHISMRTDAKPFSDVRVRQAMSLAIDRQAIIDAGFDDVRATDGVPRARQLPLRPILPGRAQEPEPHQRSRGVRHARPPATHGRPRQAARGHLRHPAPPGQAAVLRADAVRRVHRRLGGRAEELRAELRLRLRGSADGGLARSLAWVTGAGAEAVSRETPADRDPVAPDRVADRLHAAAPPARRRCPAHARGEGVREGRRGAADEARARPAALRAVFRVAGARVAGRLRRVALDAAAGAPGDRPAPARDYGAGRLRARVRAADRAARRRPLGRAPRHDPGLRRAERGDLRPLRPRLLARDAPDRAARDLVGVAARHRVHRVLEEPPGARRAVPPARAHPRHRRGGGADAAHARHAARGAAPGLRADGLGERARRAGDRDEARAPQRDHPGRHAARHAAAADHRRHGDHRDGLRLARHEPLPLRRDQPARLSRDPGREPGRRLDDRHDQPGRRRALCRPRPANPILNRRGPRWRPVHLPHWGRRGQSPRAKAAQPRGRGRSPRSDATGPSRSRERCEASGGSRGASRSARSAR